MERLEALQNKKKPNKKMVNFNLSEEVLETVHAIAMKMIFGDSIIGNEADKVRIDMGGKLVEMSLPMAFRAVWS